MFRASAILLAALGLAACGPNGSVANAASDLENASDDYGNRTNDQMDKIGNRIAPVIGNTIDRFDGNSADNAASNAIENSAG